MKNFKAIINITLRKGILDVQGKAVEQALHGLELDMLSDIRIGKRVELSVKAESKEIAFALVEDACKKLIANPIIEDFDITFNEN